jgi:uroporphyrinogen decarboxylase
MTSRELALQAVNHQQPERLPWTLYLAKPLAAKLEAEWGPRTDWPCPQDDIIRILWDVEVGDVSPTLFKDLFGCEWQREEGGYVFVNPPLAEPNADLIPRIQLLPQSDIDKIQATRAARPDAFIFYQFSACFGERLWNLRGFEQTLIDYLIEKSFVHEALDVLMDMHMAALDVLLELPIDGATFGDDFGSQRGLMISRDVFLEFYKPRHAKLYERVRSAGKVVGHHSCGDNTDLMADFVDIGLQVFHPLQPEAMDIAAIKREFGKDLTFRGGIGTQGPIVFGTPDEARREVREAVRILSDGGGYFLETAKPLPEETPVENAMAVIEEMTRSMHYEF